MPEENLASNNLSPPTSSSNLMTVRDERTKIEFTVGVGAIEQWAPIIRPTGVTLYTFYARMSQLSEEVAFVGTRLIENHLGVGHNSIMRYNWLLEQIGLIRIDHGDHLTPNVYYVLDVPELTPERLQALRETLEKHPEPRFANAITKHIDGWQPIETYFARRRVSEAVIRPGPTEEPEGGSTLEPVGGSTVEPGGSATVEPGGGSTVESAGSTLDTPDSTLEMGDSTLESPDSSLDSSDSTLDAPGATGGTEHASLLATPTIPARQSTNKTVLQLTTNYPIQPPGLSPEEAFNLALDKAIAHLPRKVRKGADAPLFTLAAELHQAAGDQPSARWPDAGGAGWVLDAVLDALGSSKPIGSIQLIRAITQRWVEEGNPYGVPGEEELDLGGIPLLDEDLPVLWEQVTGRKLSPEEHGMFEHLVTQGMPPSRMLDTIEELSTRVPQGAITVDFVMLVLRGEVVIPPIRDTRFPESPPPKHIVAQPPLLPADDPVIGQVTEWYRVEISSRITEMVAEDLRDLTSQQRDLDVWEYAFQASRHIGATKSRWTYITTIILAPNMDAIEKWKAAGKGPIRPDTKQPRQRRGRSTRATGEKRAPVVSYDDMPEAPSEWDDEPIEPPPDAPGAKEDEP
jgi:hypothetical protein